MKKLFAIAFLLLIGLNLFASDTYVATAANGGSNSNSGISTSPFLTVAYAASHTTGAGSVIHVSAGTFNEGTNEIVIPVEISLIGYGKTSTIIISRAEATDRSGYNIFHASVTLVSASQGTNGNQILSDFTLDGQCSYPSTQLGTSNGSLSYIGIVVRFRSNVIIRDCIIQNFFTGGIVFHGCPFNQAPSVYATGNQVYNCSILNCVDEAETPGSAGLIEIGGQSTMEIHDNILTQNQRPAGHNGDILVSAYYEKGIHVYNNIFTKIEDDGYAFNMHIEIWDTEGGWNVHNNEFYGGDTGIDIAGHFNYKGAYDYSWWIHENYFECNNTVKSGSNNRVGVVIEDNLVQDVIIEKNYFKNHPKPISITNGSVSDAIVERITVRYNIMDNCGWDNATDWNELINVGGDGSGNHLSDIYIYNNLVLGNSRKHFACINIESNGAILTNINIKNNICTNSNNGGWLYVQNGGTINGLHVDHNIAYGNTNNNEPYLTGNSISNYTYTPSIKSDPLFISSSDFHLQSSSPAINAGVNVGATNDYDNISVSNPPEIGAFEKTSGSSATTVVYSGHTVTSSEAGTVEAVNDMRVTVPTNLTYSNNSVTSVNTGGHIADFGQEGPTPYDNLLDGATITGNKITWNGDISNASIITHGLFLGYSKNFLVKYNYLDKTPYGILPKSGGIGQANMSYSSGGIAYNIVKNSKMSSNSKGVNGVLFYNNTYYNDQHTGRHIWLGPNTGSDGNNTPPINCKVKNNIFYSKYKWQYMIDIADPVSLTGFQSDYNLYYCEQSGGPLFRVGSTEYTFTEWRALGYDLHSVVANPNFINTTDFVPTARLDFGTNLGTTWQEGLSTDAAWTVGYSPATTTQNGSWQVGARIYAAPSSGENTYYLSPSGNDNNSGTINSPWKTLTKAWTEIVAGDIVYLRGGIYYMPSSQMLTNVNGSAGSIIKIWAYPGETPIITKVASGWTYTDRVGIYFEGDYFHWKGITLSGFNQIGNNIWNSMIVQSANHNIFEQMTFKWGSIGFDLSHWSDDNLILNCDFYRNYDPLSSYANGDGANAHTDNGTTNTFRGCRFWLNADDGLDLFNGNGLIIMDNCWGWMNGFAENKTSDGGDGYGFKLGKTEFDYSSQHLRTLTNCLAFYNGYGGFSQQDARAITWAYNNTAHHNTIKPGQYRLGFEFNDQNIANILRNNIAWDNQQTSGLEAGWNAETIQDHNSWNSNGTNSRVNGLDFLSIDTTGVSAARQPDGSLPSLSYLKLAATSDMINTGVNVGIAYIGTAPDLGAFEYGIVPSPVITLPSGTTSPATNVTVTSATIGGQVTNTGGDPNTEAGVLVGLTGNLTLGSQTPHAVIYGYGPANGTTNPFTIHLTSAVNGITPNTIFYYRIFVTNSTGTSYGTERTFTTLEAPPSGIKHLIRTPQGILLKTDDGHLIYGN